MLKKIELVQKKQIAHLGKVSAKTLGAKGLWNEGFVRRTDRVIH